MGSARQTKQTNSPGKGSGQQKTAQRQKHSVPFFRDNFRGLRVVLFDFCVPLHKHLVLNIILFLADEDADFTYDICRLSCSSSFMWKQCMFFFPSVAFSALARL